MRLIVNALLVLGVTACSAATEKPKNLSTEAAAASAPQTGPAEKKTCRDMSTTGSYGSRYVCHTKAEWEKIDALS